MPRLARSVSGLARLPVERTQDDPEHLDGVPLIRVGGPPLFRRLLLVGLFLVLLGVGPVRAQPTCSECGRALVGAYYRTSGGRLLCPQDYQRLGPRCEACSTLIVGGYVVLDGAHAVCRACHEGHPGCFVCSVPVLRGGLRLADGRVVCRNHAREAVLDVAEATRTLQAAERSVVAALGEEMRLQHPMDDVRLVGTADLDRLIGRRSSSAGHVLGLFRLRIEGQARHYTVFFLSGLPRSMLLTVAAHEYAHAWQSERNPRYMEGTERFREGFAEWVAYRVNRALGRKPEAERLLKAQTGVYTVGLRRFLDAQTRRGIPGILDLAGSGLDL